MRQAASDSSTTDNGTNSHDHMNHFSQTRGAPDAQNTPGAGENYAVFRPFNSSRMTLRIVVSMSAWWSEVFNVSLIRV